MKKLLVIGLLLSLLATNVLALQEVAGTIIISTPIGGTNSSKFGLLNDGNETIIVSLRAEGDAAKYLSFPSNVTLEPNKFVYTNITATLPSDYDTSLGSNITGTLYALQKGSPGQVQINVQLMKAVTIMVYGISKTSTSASQNPSEAGQSSPLSGFFVLVSYYLPAVILAIAIVAVVYIFKIRSDKKKLKNQSNNI
jgi:hypothetical protein